MVKYDTAIDYRAKKVAFPKEQVLKSVLKKTTDSHEDCRIDAFRATGILLTHDRWHQALSSASEIPFLEGSYRLRYEILFSFRLNWLFI